MKMKNKKYTQKATKSKSNSMMSTLKSMTGKKY